MKTLKILRKKRHISGYSVAKKLGRLPQSLWSLEKKSTKIDMPTLLKLKKIIGFSWLEFGKEIEKEYGSEEKTEN